MEIYLYVRASEFVSVREEETDSLIFSMNRATLIRGRMKERVGEKEIGRDREEEKERKGGEKEREMGGGKERGGITLFPSDYFPSK